LPNAFAGIFYPDEKKERLKFQWMQSSILKHQQTYLENTNILKTAAIDARRTKIVSTDYVLPDQNILVRNYSITNLDKEVSQMKFYFYENLWIDSRFEGSCVYYNDTLDLILHERENIHFAIGGDKKTANFTCGVKDTDSEAYSDALDGSLSSIDHASDGDVDSCLEWNLGELKPKKSFDLTVFIAVAHDAVEAADLIKQVRGKSPKTLLTETVRFWGEWINKGNRIKIGDERVLNLYNRSLLMMRLLWDKNYGAIIAAPTVDPDYRYVWPRDAGYMSVALDLAGYCDIQEKYFEWCKKTQEEDGSWLQNYYVNGKKNWRGLQVDQTGTILWAIWIHYQQTKDKTILTKFWDMIMKAAEFLYSFIDETANISKPCYDLWEERVGSFNYTNAMIYKGLSCASSIAKILGKEELCDKWFACAEKLKKEVNIQFWSHDKQRFLKSINPEDPTIDVSILGLTFPGEVVPASDQRMVTTAEQIYKAFHYAKGGIGRYVGDAYYTGNPWIITSLWLAIYYLEVGRSDRVKKLFEWCLESTLENGLMAEQVHKENGNPLSAVPLGWSHAMFVLCVLKMLEKNFFA
jgi:oligosaccharide amylase